MRKEQNRMNGHKSLLSLDLLCPFTQWWWSLTFIKHAVWQKDSKKGKVKKKTKKTDKSEWITVSFGIEWRSQYKAPRYFIFSVWIWFKTGWSIGLSVSLLVIFFFLSAWIWFRISLKSKNFPRRLGDRKSDARKKVRKRSKWRKWTIYIIQQENCPGEAYFMEYLVYRSVEEQARWAENDASRCLYFLLK